MDMVMQNNYPDYKKISELANKLSEIQKKDEHAHDRHFNQDAFDREERCEEELRTLLIGTEKVVEGKSCHENYCYEYCHDAQVYYPSKVHHLDGDHNNNSFSNLAMVCPSCKSHILLSRLSAENIWLLKTRGLNNAEIGRVLGISRERVRQLCNKYQKIQRTKQTEFLATDPNILVKRAQAMEDQYIEKGTLTRRIDKRTKKKRIIAGLKKLQLTEANES
jgi:hypothetical protein